MRMFRSRTRTAKGVVTGVRHYRLAIDLCRLSKGNEELLRRGTETRTTGVGNCYITIDL